MFFILAIFMPLCHYLYMLFINMHNICRSVFIAVWLRLVVAVRPLLRPCKASVNVNQTRTKTQQCTNLSPLVHVKWTSERCENTARGSVQLDRWAFWTHRNQIKSWAKFGIFVVHTTAFNTRCSCFGRAMRWVIYPSKMWIRTFYLHYCQYADRQLNGDT